MSKVVFMIDGWFMRKRVYQLKTFFYNGLNIRIANSQKYLFYYPLNCVLPGFGLMQEGSWAGTR